MASLVSVKGKRGKAQATRHLEPNYLLSLLLFSPLVIAKYFQRFRRNVSTSQDGPTTIRKKEKKEGGEGNDDKTVKKRRGSKGQRGGENILERHEENSLTARYVTSLESLIVEYF